MSESKAVKDLLGAKPAAEQFGWQINPQGVMLTQPFVSRDAKQKFEAELTQQARILLEVENPEDEKILLEQLSEYFRPLFTAHLIDTDTTPLGRELAALSSYGLDPTDLQPDQIDRFVAAVKNHFNQENSDKINFTYGGKASFLGVGVETNLGVSGEKLRKLLTDKGWEFKSNGRFSVPKQFEVYIRNDNALKTTGTFNSSIVRRLRDFTRFNARLSTSNLYRPAADKDTAVELAELRAEVARLVEAESKHRVDRGPNYIQIGDDLLICWGKTGQLTGDPKSGQRHVRRFKFEFPKPFATPPAVTTGFDLESNGHIWSVYNTTLTNMVYEGSSFDGRSDDATVVTFRGGRHNIGVLPVTISYIAIGKPDPKKK